MTDESEIPQCEMPGCERDGDFTLDINEDDWWQVCEEHYYQLTGQR